MAQSPRQRVIRFRVSEEEHAALAAKAAAVGGFSALLRDHAGKVTIRDRDAERQRNATLNRINANLNMIARWVNTWKGQADAFKVLVRLEAIQDEVLRCIERWEEQADDRRLLEVRHGQRPRRR